MVNGEAQILDPMMSLSSLSRGQELEVSFSSSEEITENSLVEKITEKLDMRSRFARLKRRLRSRPSSIL